MAVGIVRASDYGARTQEYLAEVEDAVMIMCQIESAGAVENAREIAAVEGVDMLFIGFWVPTRPNSSPIFPVSISSILPTRTFLTIE